MIAHFPSRFKLLYVLIFAVLLATFELLQGSDPYCVGCVFVFVMIAGDAFNRCGGFIYASGSYVFFFSILTLILGATWKVFLWEPLDRNLLAPQLTFTVYAVGMGLIWVASTVNARIRTKRPLMKTDIPVQQELRAAMGCLAFGLFLTVALPLLSLLGIGSILRQMDRFYPLAIMLAVYYRVRQTRGEQSFSGVALLSWFVGFFFGLLSFSKQGLFTPFVAWVFGALAAGYKTTVKQIVILGMVGVALLMILVPYSQYGRSHTGEFSNPFEVMVLMVTNPQVFTEKSALVKEEASGDRYKFFDEPQGLLNRLNMLTLDDPLILRTSMGHYEGWSVLKNYLINTLPHFILPDKPTVRYGNHYAHEIGLLAKEDETTGVSFSPIAEAFHMAGWVSLITVLPGVLILLFWVSDSMVGSLRDGPWALFFILIFSHAAPEGNVGSVIYLATYGVIALFFAIFMATKIAPLVGTVLIGPGRMPIPSQRNLPPVRSRRVGT